MHVWIVVRLSLSRGLNVRGRVVVVNKDLLRSKARPRGSRLEGRAVSTVPNHVDRVAFYLYPNSQALHFHQAETTARIEASTFNPETPPYLQI